MLVQRGVDRNDADVELRSWEGVCDVKRPAWNCLLQLAQFLFCGIDKGRWGAISAFKVQVNKLLWGLSTMTLLLQWLIRPGILSGAPLKTKPRTFAQSARQEF